MESTNIPWHGCTYSRLCCHSCIHEYWWFQSFIIAKFTTNILIYFVQMWQYFWPTYLKVKCLAERNVYYILIDSAKFWPKETIVTFVNQHYLFFWNVTSMKNPKGVGSLEFKFALSKLYQSFFFPLLYWFVEVLCIFWIVETLYILGTCDICC